MATAALLGLSQLARLDPLVIDNFAISPMGAPERNGVLEPLDKRRVQHCRHSLSLGRVLTA